MKDDFFKKAQILAKNTMDNVKKQAESAKGHLNEMNKQLQMKVEIDSMKSELTDLFASYGRICYEESPLTGTKMQLKGQITKTIDAIDKKEKELEAIQSKVEVYCTNCGAKYSKGEQFCSKCGTSLV